VRFVVLGPVQVLVNGDAVNIAATKERSLLAILLSSANHVVSTTHLIDELWGEVPPKSAHKTLQTYVSHLRKVVGDQLETVTPGYRLRVDPGAFDADDFERLVERGRMALLRNDATTARDELGDALSLWNGTAYDGVDAGSDVHAERVRMTELRSAASEDWYEARLSAGDTAAVIAELEAEITAQPLRERLWSLLMHALYRAGRQGDALEAYQRARRTLLDELGIEPGPELRAVEAAVLGQRLGLALEGPSPPPVQYVANDDGLLIGYSTIGDGPNDIVFLGDVFMNVELLWEFSDVAPLFEAVLATGRIISVQRQGTGSSDGDRNERFASPAACVADVDAVLDAVHGDDQVTLVGWGHGCQVAIAYAARRADRVARVVLVNGYARLSDTDGYDVGHPARRLDGWLGLVAEKWGREVSAAPIAGPIGNDPHFIARQARWERLTASPRDAVALHRALNDIDVRDLVGDVTCPALVIFLADSVTGRAVAEWLAAQLPFGQFRELPGTFLPTAAEAASVGAAISRFVAETR